MSLLSEEILKDVELKKLLYFPELRIPKKVGALNLVKSHLQGI